MNKIQAELTIHLEHKIEAKDNMPERVDHYRLSLPVGANWDAAIAFSKEMTKQVEAMKQRSEDALKKESEKKESELEIEAEKLD